VRKVLRCAAQEDLSPARDDDRLSMNVIRGRNRANALGPIIWGLRRQGETPSSIGRELTRREIPAARGGKWRPQDIMRLFRRTAAAFALPEDRDFLAQGEARRQIIEKRNRELAQISWELRNKGYSCEAIAREFDRRMFKPPQGRRWSPGTVRRLLLASRPANARIGDEKAADVLGRSKIGAKKRAMKIARQIWELRASGMAIWAIAGELNRQKIPSSMGRRWHNDSVSLVLELTRDDFPHLAKAIEDLPAAREAALLEAAQRIWNLRLSGMSAVSVAEELERQGVETLSRATRWTANSVLYIVRRTMNHFAANIEAITKHAHPIRARAVKSAMSAAPMAWQLRAQGLTYAAISSELNRQRVAALNGDRWFPRTVSKLLRRTASEFPSMAAAVATSPGPRQVCAQARVSKLGPIAWAMRAANMTLCEIADEFNRRDFASYRGQRWREHSIAGLLQTSAKLSAPVARSRKYARLAKINHDPGAYRKAS
jgi:hypothetical protein